MSVASPDPRFCRVCGYEPEEPAWGADGARPSWEICPCCGVEHGYEDSRPAGVARYRQRWLAGGALWWDHSTPADGFETAARLARVDPERAPDQRP